MKFPIGFALEDMPPKAEMERLTQQSNICIANR